MRHFARRGSASATPARAGRNLNHLARIPQTDRDRPAQPWPAPLGVEPAPPTSRRPRQPTGPLPISPGKWGRPPEAETRPALPPWLPLGAPPLLPLPPEVATTERTPRSRPPSRRWRGAVIEVAVALAILLTVALVSGRNGAASAPGASTATTAWDRSAIPIIIQLVDDLTAIEDDTAPNQAISLTRLRQDDTNLRRDVAAAQALPSPPPGPTLAALWTASLQQLTGDRAALDATLAQPTSTAIARLRQQLAMVGAGLLQLGQSVQSRG